MPVIRDIPVSFDITRVLQRQGFRDFSKVRPAIEVDSSIPGTRVVDVLEELAETRELPEVITVDNGL